MQEERDDDLSVVNEVKVSREAGERREDVGDHGEPYGARVEAAERREVAGDPHELVQR